jgi:SAM-dependent methyltransferase
MSVSYDNRSYWTSLHETLKGELRAVGHPFLSESMNRLKYESEAESVLIGLKKISEEFRQLKRIELSLLDVGAGYGYWTGLVCDSLSQNAFRVNASALDLSPEALRVLQARLPHVNTIHADLRTISPNRSEQTYDLVSACYCLHHLTRASDFLNALQFVGRSVNQGGFLLMMDPVLTMPFSKADTLDFESFRGNGIPRHLYFVDDLLAGLGLRRSFILPAVSFILNENIEAPDRLSFYAMMTIWKLLCRLDRIENFAQRTAGIFKSVDSVLKRRGLAFSSTVCVYQKTDAVSASSVSI